MRIILTITTLAILTAYAIYGFATVERRSDEAQIQGLFVNAADAVQKRNLNGALSCLSKDYKDDQGRNYDAIRLLAVNIMKNGEVNYTVDAKPGKVVVSGDEATLQARVKAKGTKSEFEYEREMTLHLTRENGRHAWFLPAKVWRVTNIENLGINLDSQW